MGMVDPLAYEQNTRESQVRVARVTFRPINPQPHCTRYIQFTLARTLRRGRPASPRGDTLCLST